MDTTKNTELYNRLRSIENKAHLKEFTRNGFTGTSINPIDVIETLTREFGPCGTGWNVELTRTWHHSASDGTTCVFVQLGLSVKREDGTMSTPIPSIGSANLISVITTRHADKTVEQVQTIDDEAYKKAYTDALGKAAKMLGYGADIYEWNDSNKYADFHKKTEGTVETKKIAAATRQGETVAPSQKQTVTPEKTTFASSELDSKDMCLLLKRMKTLYVGGVKRNDIYQKINANRQTPVPNALFEKMMNEITTNGVKAN